MKISFLFFLCVSILLSGCCNYYNFEKSVKSGVKIILFNKSGEISEVTRGNGIYIGGGKVITAAHVVESYRFGSNLHFLTNNMIFWARLTYIQNHYRPGKNDIAIIEYPHPTTDYLQSAIPMPLCALALGSKDNYQLISYRSSYPIAKNALHLDDASPYLDGAYERGISGAGIVNVDKNCLVGIVSFSNNVITEQIVEAQSNALSTTSGKLFFTPVSEIKKLLDAWNIHYDIQE